MALPCVDFDIKLFVDRVSEKTKLEKIVSFSVGQKDEEKPQDYQRVLHLVGKSQVGKSYLLCNYHTYLEEKNIYGVGLSFANYCELRGDQFIVHVLRSLYDQIAPHIAAQPRDILAMTAKDLSEFFVNAIRRLEKKNIVAFLLDEVSMLSEDQVHSIEDQLLMHILNFPNVVIVLAGRHLINGWKMFALRPVDRTNVVELSGFEFEYTQEQIQVINPQVNDFVSDIHRVSNGSPGNNRKIVDQLGDPPHFDELSAIHACNQEFYDALAVARTGLPENISNELLPALEALCVLQDFDKEYEMPVMLSNHPALKGAWIVQRCADLLHILSKVQVGPGKLVDWDRKKSALALEEQTRVNLEKELMIRNIDLWKVLHCTAMKMYTDWAENYGMDSIFADKADYHKRKLINAGVDPETCG